MSSNDFLQAVLGIEGSSALLKATEKIPILETILVPRTIISWLTSAIRIQYEGEMPGIDDSYIVLNKSEKPDTYSGAMTIGEVVYTFESEPLLHVAAALGVALGVGDKQVDPLLKGQDLSNLGKTIDLLVKAKLITKTLKNGIQIDKEELPGQAAKPLEPEKPVSALPQTKQSMPPRKALKKELKITKEELSKTCKECGKPHFNNSKFIGCFCFKDLAKSASLIPHNDEFVLKLLGSDWDEETTEALIAALKE